MLSELLNKETIQIAHKVDSWKDAIRLASSPLLQQQKIEQRYLEAMIQAIEEHGPYVVLTPKVAIPHARPTEGVNELSMSLLSLQNPVHFAPDQPVYLIIVLAAIDDASHLQALVDLTQVLQEPTQIDSIIACQHPENIVEKIKHYATKEQI
ncbi:PTS sugar transporter subunit IIA [Lysinibacillus sphaericus]|uniref:Ascorbate-specific PTS system EIIA component n=1 Tax=Lysinibacillus sphaericus OT4b.31 TaxID=1285586 RepID=R7ZFI1_LYSSH|nr:PTS sugar transporter subunit IIA [Lysinibacillus sphaericus]EON72796.1 ascorbate-specific phosphotransferase IIA component [Lysinibacillus sphaericus OT4b.31]